MADPPDEYLAGDQMIPYQTAAPGVCWWCGSLADSREHKFKRTDLARMAEGSELLWGSHEDLVTIRSLRKSSVVRFKPNLCAGCNNHRSQPFDYAYDLYAEYVWSNLDRLWRSRYLDMASIYGTDWKPGVLNLARYVAKHIACRMSSDGYEVPPQFKGFLNGAPFLAKVHVVLFKDPATWKFRRHLKRQGIEGGGLWFAPATGAVSRSRQRLTMYSSSLSLAHIGFMYRWDEDANDVDPFYRYRRARLHRRDHLPDQ